MVPANSVRAFEFLAGVFRSQQQDPLCGKCKAFVNSVAAVRAALQQFEADHSPELAGFADDLDRRYAEASSFLESIVLPENAPGQKKAGNCFMPPGVCFVKASVAILDKIKTADTTSDL